ncbi:DinB family protein [Deinococcus sp. MIMF12]|uniref:DinB family protein n=1 Tax=Deinococcus rhizophilus TaxID=3049544 RepID=A0ABT7JEI7_9DEIO|nr:DinB family protein [Deinococcus rhizophilus]MDL2343469.1 DinB family protein [Deinococcus rhizophilus]
MPGLRETVLEHLPRLQAISEARAGHQPAPEVWSAKQIIGHLIDSGVNNHARFVRAGAEDGLSLPGYDQDLWVAAGAYQERSWAGLLALWEAYQLQLAQVMERLSPQQRSHTLTVGGGEPVTVQFLAEDYVRHQLHHLAQIPERVGP